jgi:hypothetical protein
MEVRLVSKFRNIIFAATGIGIALYLLAVMVGSIWLTVMLAVNM